MIHIQFVEQISEPYQHEIPFPQSLPQIVQESSEANRKDSSIPAAAKPSLIAFVSLSQMLKLGKVIVPEMDIVTVHLEEFSVAEMRWL